MDNIIRIHQELKDKTYRHGQYQAFKINDPKQRQIHKASVRDRLVHHAIYRVLYSHFDSKFIFDSYSCRRNKGTHRAINRFRQYGRKVSRNNTQTAWILKCDVVKFFANIDHKILITCLEQCLEEDDTMGLLKEIINSFHTPKMKGKGLPLGNLTSEYKKELPNYINKDLITDDLCSDALRDLKTNNKNGSFDDPTSWGNKDYYVNTLNEEFKKFDEDEKKRVLILNPDWHSVSKAGSQFKITFKADLTVAEKTRIISERLFILAKNKWDSDQENQDSKARYLSVFEEAHSLIPEWNSAANSGDQSASNGTAKVILQGRKYGFGSLVVTQRTANISKSILNQCNTIFALRVFDDTGKQFLENYIGSDYANTLPTLAERNAIVVGKALKLKQPVIIRLNEKDSIVKKT